MRKLLLALVLALLPSFVWAQCNGVFPAHTFCGNATGSPAIPSAVPQSTTAAPAGTNGQVQFNNAGSLGGLTNTQLTADINAFTSTLSGSAPASGGGTVNFLRADGTWASAVVSCGTGLTGSTSCALALNSAVLNGLPANPAATSQTSPGAMMGLGSTCHLTPTYSTRVEFYIYGQVANGTGGNATAIQARFGTGTAPVNGAANTGNTLGTAITTTTSTASGGIGFWVGGIAIALTAGTAYWFDLSAFVNAGTSTISNVTCVAKEIL